MHECFGSTARHIDDMQEIAVIIPCHNEALTIAKVVTDFRHALPEATVHVFDNKSDDDTARIAKENGAVVHFVPVLGKGAVVRQMFREIDASFFLMVDGDDTYPAEKARALLAPLFDGRAEMTVGTRLQDHETQSFRAFHVFGNHLVLKSINFLFQAQLTDVLSGYRGFTRRFVKTTPILSKSFEVETELTLHALQYQLPVCEVPVPYGARPEGSVSKLNTFRDGYRVLKTILRLYKDYQPLAFFGLLGAMALSFGLFAGIVAVQEWLELGVVLGVSRAVLAALAIMSGMLSVATGLILDTVNRRSLELMTVISDYLVNDPGVR